MQLPLQDGIKLIIIELCLCLSLQAAQRTVAASAPATGPTPSLVTSRAAQSGTGAPSRRSATRITLELLKTRGLRGLYKGAGATLMRYISLFCKKKHISLFYNIRKLTFDK